MQGFVPVQLKECLKFWHLDISTITDCILKFMHHLIFNMHAEIWKKRCEKIIIQEHSMGITKQVKNKGSSRSNITSFGTFPLIHYDRSSDIVTNSHNIDDYNLWCELACQYGGKWQDF